MNNKIVKRFELAKAEEKKSEAIESVAKRLEEWRLTHTSRTKTEDDLIKKLSDLKSGVLSVYDGISFGSPKQLQQLLYFDDNRFKFKSLETGTGKDILTELEPQDKTGFIKELLKLRSMEKMQGTYLKGILQRLDRDNRIHKIGRAHV